MKNKIKLLGIIAIIALIGLSFAGCDTGGGGEGGGGTNGATGSGNPGPQTARYESMDSDGNTYVLEITNAASGRAVYTPKNGDTYVLTIIYVNGTTKTSNGTVAIKETVFELTPTGSETKITITLEKTETAVLIIGISGTIEGVKIEVSNINPVQEFKSFDLKAEKHPNIESWTNIISLSEFTAYEPKKGDKLEFKISGEMKQPLKWFSVGLSSQINKDPWYRWLGGMDDTYIFELPAKFNHTFAITTGNDPLAPNSVKIGFSNILWQIGDGDNSDWSHVTGSRVNDADVGKVMATISNFKISLVKITPAE